MTTRGRKPRNPKGPPVQQGHASTGEAPGRRGGLLTLGLYASRESDGARLFGEQTQMFGDLVHLGRTSGVDVVVLTPGYKRERRGWRYDLMSRTWSQVPIPLPDVIVRRSGTFHANAASVDEDLRFFSACGRLHTLPRTCSNKWRFYQEMRASSHIRGHLPETALAYSAADVLNFLRIHRDIYVKPVNGAQGISIYHAVMNKGVITVSWEKRIVPRGSERRQKRFYAHTEVMERKLNTAKAFESYWKDTGLRRCIVQKTVPLLRTVDARPFDFRWLVQFADGPKVMARVGRLGGARSVTTNIHTGGEAVPAAQVLEVSNAESILSDMDEVALAVVAELRKQHGPFAEVGIDLAVSSRGDIVVFEVNPTPGRRMLRSLPGNVREMSLQRLLEYAIRATGNSNRFNR